MNTIIVSRHQGLVEWLNLQGIYGEVMTHVENIDQIRGKTVIGNLPLHMAAACNQVITVDLPGLRQDQRGKDLSPAEMTDAGAVLRAYVVRENEPQIEPRFDQGWYHAEMLSEYNGNHPEWYSDVRIHIRSKVFIRNITGTHRSGPVWDEWNRWSVDWDNIEYWDGVRWRPIREY